MEQTIAYVLGVLSVLALAGVYSMFKTRVQIKDLYTEIEDLQNVINDLEREIHRDNEMLDRRIDQEIDRIDNISHKLHDYADTLNNHTHDEMDKLYAYVDSRTDKMADGISKHIADINTKFNDNTTFVDKLYHMIEENKLVQTK
jgi:DNA repair exonuclease SbcCD ATPase subunit